jgi:hypothetical protein
MVIHLPSFPSKGGEDVRNNSTLASPSPLGQVGMGSCNVFYKPVFAYQIAGSSYTTNPTQKIIPPSLYNRNRMLIIVSNYFE